VQRSTMTFSPRRLWRVLAAACLCTLSVRALGAAKEEGLCSRAAVFTPHDLTDSEQTRYLFGVVSSLQMMWCEYVDVLVTEGNACRSNACFESGPMQPFIRTGSKFGYTPQVKVIATPAAGQADLHPLDDPEALLTDKYDVFVLVGTTKLPPFRGIGQKINFYVCEFPFDRDVMQSDDKIALLTSYDGVIASSVYSRNWYLSYIRPYFLRAHSQGSMLPDVHLILPPVPLLKKLKQAPHFSALNNTIHIAFYGDYFPGEDNHGHMSALALFARLQKEFVYAHLHMYMLGRRVAAEGADEYVAGLQRVAEKDASDVTFIFDPSQEQLSVSIGSSLIFW
jgi:hypothetical protein